MLAGRGWIGPSWAKPSLVLEPFLFGDSYCSQAFPLWNTGHRPRFPRAKLSLRWGKVPLSCNPIFRLQVKVGRQKPNENTFRNRQKVRNKSIQTTSSSQPSHLILEPVRISTPSLILEPCTCYLLLELQKAKAPPKNGLMCLKARMLSISKCASSREPVP